MSHHGLFCRHELSTTAKIDAGGGSIAMVHQVPTGQWIAVCKDPQGAEFALTAWQR